MNKQMVVCAVISGAIGATVGAIVTDYILKKKYQKKADDEINKALDEINTALEKVHKKPEEEEQKPEQKEAPKKTETEETFDYRKYANQMVRDEGYISDDEDEDEEEDADEELFRKGEELDAVMKAFKEKHAGKIEVITLDDWDTDFPEVDYDREELYYFTDGGVLTDELGKLCDEKIFCDDKLDKYGFKTNGNAEEKVYLRNNPLEKMFLINKVTDCDREGYFGNYPLDDEVRNE